MPVEVVKSLEEFQKTISDGNIHVFDFWATWCGPCRMISPIFEKLSGSIEGVQFHKVDVDAVPDVAQEVGIRAMPTFMAFKDGQKIEELVGANPSALETLIRTAAEKK